MKVMKSVVTACMVAIMVAGVMFSYGCPPPPVEVPDPEEEPLTFGMVVKFPALPFIQAFMYGAERRAEELGVELYIKDNSGCSILTMEHIDTLILKGIDGFVMAGAVDLKALVPGIERLNELNIPVMAIDTSPEGGRVELFIAGDIKQDTIRATEILIEGIRERHGGEVPEGVVLEITGSLVDMWAITAKEGFRKVMDRYPQLTIASGEGHWNNVDSHRVTTDLLAAHGDEIIAIYVQTPDIMGLGVVGAIEAAGRNPADYGITGVWMGPEGIAMIEAGQIRAIVAPPAIEPAEMAIQFLYNLNRGLPIPQIGDVVVEEDAIWSPAKVVESRWAEGGYMILRSPVVPDEVSTDDPRLWENRLAHLWEE